MPSTLAEEGFDFALDLEPEMSWRSWLRLVALQHAGIGLPVDRVPATFLIADLDGVVAGRVSIRHRLNEWLLQRGGHVGYGVVPDLRRRGVGTRILQDSLVVGRALGIERALLTCDADNVASIKVIEACGGRLDPQQPHPIDEPETLRYWID